MFPVVGGLTVLTAFAALVGPDGGSRRFSVPALVIGLVLCLFLLLSHCALRRDVAADP